MTSQVLEKKLDTLQQEVTMLRSAVVGVLIERDPEGEYRPEFVAKVLKSMRAKKGGTKFTGAADFLREIRRR